MIPSKSVLCRPYNAFKLSNTLFYSREELAITIRSSLIPLTTDSFRKEVFSTHLDRSPHHTILLWHLSFVGADRCGSVHAENCSSLYWTLGSHTNRVSLASLFIVPQLVKQFITKWARRGAPAACRHGTGVLTARPWFAFYPHYSRDFPAIGLAKWSFSPRLGPPFPQEISSLSC